MSETEKLAAIRGLAASMNTNQDEYAVGLAADVLALIDGTVTSDEILAASCQTPPPATVGDCLTVVLSAR